LLIKKKFFNFSYFFLIKSLFNKLLFGLGFVFLGVWFFTFLISKYSSLSSLFGSLSVPIYLFFFTSQNLVFFLIMFILIFYTHRENVKRLKNKEESKTKIY